MTFMFDQYEQASQHFKGTVGSAVWPEMVRTCEWLVGSSPFGPNACQFHKAFLSFTGLVSSTRVFPLYLVNFQICYFHFILGLPLPWILSVLVSHPCLHFLLLSILIRCPNHLNSLLSIILVPNSRFSIPLIWLDLILKKKSPRF
jgi:hypothetical protein